MDAVVSLSPMVLSSFLVLLVAVGFARGGPSIADLGGTSFASWVRMVVPTLCRLRRCPSLALKAAKPLSTLPPKSLSFPPCIALGSPLSLVLLGLS